MAKGDYLNRKRMFFKKQSEHQKERNRYSKDTDNTIAFLSSSLDYVWCLKTKL